MGKLLALLTAGVVFAAGYLMLDTRNTGKETEKHQASYEETVVAHEIAQSAYNATVSEVKRDFEGWRQQQSQVAYQGGSYDVTVTGPDEGPVEVVITGQFGAAGQQILGTVDRALFFLEPLVFDVGEVEIKDSGNAYTISGHDVKPPSEGGGAGNGPGKNAIRSTTQPAHDDVVAGFKPNRVIGIDGAGDMIVGYPEVDLDALYNDVRTTPGTEVFDDTTLNNTFGSAAAPQVLIVYGNVKLSGNFRGYGVMYVGGNLRMSGNARWEGLILVDGGADKVDISGSSALYGSMVVRGAGSSDDDGAGLPGGHFDVDVFDGPTSGEEYHQHQYDDKFDLSYVDLLNAGCGSGGLCWDQIIGAGGYGELRVEFFNANASSGSYSFVANGQSFSGAPDDGFSYTFDPSTLTNFVVDFDDLGNMRCSSPGTVQGDVPYRDNAFAVRLYETATDELVYELAVYHHAKSEECVGGSSEGAAGDIEFKIAGSSGIYYSSEALIRLGPLVQSIDEAVKIAVVKQRKRSTDLSGKYSAE